MCRLFCCVVLCVLLCFGVLLLCCVVQWQMRLTHLFLVEVQAARARVGVRVRFMIGFRVKVS